MTLLAPFHFVGRTAAYTVEFIGAIGLLLRDAVVRAKPGLITGRGKRLGRANLWAQMVRVGVKSIGIISLVVFCIGAILSLQMQPILSQYGAVEKIADIIGIAMLRELGPLVAAITLTGFAGASIAAELGTMKVSEELEALESSAIDPVRFLVVPRVLATTVMMVCLAVIADLMGVAGGLFVCSTLFGLSPEAYLDATFTAVKTRDFASGLLKSAVFGAALSLIACHLGMTVRGGAAGVGDATTKTVVYTIVALTFIDLGFTAVFYYLGF
ncbi:MAG TPA: ABC transporter permease [Tepidisphaeraceae bacterium]|jgi:phospholipid/cholesterol/gamma-HCH transport system permease protein